VKSEIRRPKSEGNPKAEIRVSKRSQHRAHSDFGFRISFGLRISAFGISLFALASSAQPKGAPPSPPPLDPAQAEIQGKALVAELLARQPESSITNNGILKIQEPKHPWREVPVKFSIVQTADGWTGLYEAVSNDSQSGQAKLKIIHANSQPNRYELAERGQSGVTTRVLTGQEAMIPFAGSDFWLADLGLEFLHWPQQRILKRELRRSQYCNVLESVDPHPAPGGYSRVVSWIDTETGGIVHAEAFRDDGDEPLKKFDPTEFKKILPFENRFQSEGPVANRRCAGGDPARRGLRALPAYSDFRS
jgi:hypothetical protein